MRDTLLNKATRGSLFCIKVSRYFEISSESTSCVPVTGGTMVGSALLLGSGGLPVHGWVPWRGSSESAFAPEERASPSNPLAWPTAWVGCLPSVVSGGALMFRCPVLVLVVGAILSLAGLGSASRTPSRATSSPTSGSRCRSRCGIVSVVPFVAGASAFAGASLRSWSRFLHRRKVVGMIVNKKSRFKK